jgi:hypothetical protein
MNDGTVKAMVMPGGGEMGGGLPPGPLARRIGAMTACLMSSRGRLGAEAKRLPLVEIGRALVDAAANLA